MAAAPTATLSIDGRAVGRGDDPAPALHHLLDRHGLRPQSLAPVNDDYAAPFAYPGRIREVVFEVPAATPPGEVRATVRAEMVRQ